MLFDQIYPFAHDAHPSDAPVPNRSPFLDPEFVTYMANLSWTDRFDAQREDPYHWYKALQLRLLPAALHELLPRYKSHYGEAYRRYLEDLWPQPPLALHDLGVMHPIRYADLRRRHPYLPLAVRNVELWLRGALERGFAVAD